MNERERDAVGLLQQALGEVGGQTSIPEDGDAQAADLILHLGGLRIPVQVKRWAVFPERALRVNPVFQQKAPPSVLRVVVADRIGKDERQALQSAGWGWLDLRGTLHIQGPNVLVHSEVQPAWERPGPRDPLRAPAGLAVACALLSQPTHEHTVRGLARRLNRSPSTVSEVLNALKRDSLVEGEANQPSSELFWSVADVWPRARVDLARAPSFSNGPDDRVLQFGFGDAESVGWALTDTLAAASYGAPVAARADQPADYFVPSETVLRRARKLLGVASSSGEASATVRVAPVPEVCSTRVDARRWSSGTRPLAAPIFVALDLAQDAGRGREILNGWDLPEGWARVW